jgi:hypothetical protein
MDLYDSGVDFDAINKEFPLIQVDYFDDFDNEIYVASRQLEKQGTIKLHLNNYDYLPIKCPKNNFTKQTL